MAIGPDTVTDVLKTARNRITFPSNVAKIPADPKESLVCRDDSTKS